MTDTTELLTENKNTELTSTDIDFLVQFNKFIQDRRKTQPMYRPSLDDPMDWLADCVDYFTNFKFFNWTLLEQYLKYVDIVFSSNNGNDTFGNGAYNESYLPSDIDMRKSRLFERVRAGKHIYKHPPPKANSYPWYRALESTTPIALGWGIGYGPLLDEDSAALKWEIIWKQDSEGRMKNHGLSKIFFYSRVTQDSFQIIGQTSCNDPPVYLIKQPNNFYEFILKFDQNYDYPYDMGGKGSWMLLNKEHSTEQYDFIEVINDE